MKSLTQLYGEYSSRECQTLLRLLDDLDGHTKVGQLRLYLIQREIYAKREESKEKEIEKLNLNSYIGRYFKIVYNTEGSSSAKRCIALARVDGVKETTYDKKFVVSYLSLYNNDISFRAHEEISSDIITDNIGCRCTEISREQFDYQVELYNKSINFTL